MMLAERGISRALDAHVVACTFDAAGHAGFALGDGRLWFYAEPDWRQAEIADGALLSLATDPGGQGFVCGDDTGGLNRVAADGAITGLARYPRKWVDHVACYGGMGQSGVIAASVGKTLHFFDGAGSAIKSVAHPSTVTGIAFDAKGKRVAASHYNGASIWYVASKTDNPRVLDWKGSHTGIAFHPAGDAVVTAMQENALHGWRLADGQHMRMSGYPAKTQSLSFTRGGKYLASSGADAVVLWPFFGGGPMGKAPLELAGGRDVLCSQVACHPMMELCAAGFADGMVVLADIGTQRLVPVAPAGHGAVTGLAWSTDGALLAIGTEEGFAAVVDFSAR